MTIENIENAIIEYYSMINVDDKEDLKQIRKEIQELRILKRNLKKGVCD